MINYLKFLLAMPIKFHEWSQHAYGQNKLSISFMSYESNLGDYIKLSQVSICISTFGLYIHSHRLQI